MLINFKEVISENELKEVEALATIIWRQHYTPIIGEDQVTYMLEKFQSVETMRGQIGQGYHYFLINDEDVSLGYLSYEKRLKKLFLSKIYVLQNYRGKGIGTLGMKFVMDTAKTLGCTVVSLTVNKYNHNSIKAYEKLGFINKKGLVQDIGGGFVMDDYLMEIRL
ncbi:N-acetyltransferase family protein [Lutimonas sp.]|uniref:GNAT family N-acetyltransferase n=1 Tax=Lutimonas sp. TaxID=1872403 RepID=UPI003D9BD2BA